MSRHDPRVRLRHMLDAARDGIEIAQGRTRADLDRDKMLTMRLPALAADLERILASEGA